MPRMRYLAAIISAAVVGCAVGLVASEEPTPRTHTQIVRPSFAAGGKHEVVPTNRAFRPLAGNPELAVFRSSGCGVERWAVKTLTDPAASLVTLAVQESNVADLTSIAPPIEPTDRVNPTEETEFQIQGTVTFAKPERDGDYHLVVDDGAGHTMIVESPNPACASGSLVLSQITQVREQLDAQLPGLQRGETLRPNESATVDGIGFFDRLHGQTGVAKNGIELHPCLSIRFTPVNAARAPGFHLTRLVEQPRTD